MATVYLERAEAPGEGLPRPFQLLGAPGIPGLVTTTPQFLPLFLHDFSSVSVSSLIRTQSQD